MNTTCTQTTRTRSLTQGSQNRSAEDLLRDVAFALRLARQTAQSIRDEAARVNAATLRVESDPQPTVAI